MRRWDDSGGRPRVAVYKFTSCDGCQLAFLNAGEALLQLAEEVDIVHFAEAGPVQMYAPVNIAYVEGSISTPEEVERIRRVRESAKYLITIGACATAGGIQALRNFAYAGQWMQAVYASPEYIETLATSTPISDHVKVDLELWGCPVNTHQVMMAVRTLLFGAEPVNSADSVCLECKRRGNVCVLVAKGEACLGPVTRTGCGALCPSVGRDCYGCYGPDENPNTDALSRRFEGLGLLPDDVVRRFWFINNQTTAFASAGRKAKEQSGG